jgi:cytochrome c oxidase subunit 2
MVAGLLGGLALLFSGCSIFSSPQNTFAPAGEVAKDQRWLFLLTMWFALGIMIFVELGLVVMLVVFRKRKGHEALPKQVHGNNLLEIGWTIAPALLLLAFVPFVVAGIVNLGERPKDALVIEVNAFRFGWYYGYVAPDGTVVEGDPSTTADPGPGMYIPIGRKVELRLRSADVIHSFWAPKLAGKTDVIPGRTNTMWIKGDELGEFGGQCAEFCGQGHAYMRLTVKVVTQAEYDAYVQGLVAARDGTPESGAQGSVQPDGGSGE